MNVKSRFLVIWAVVLFLGAVADAKPTYEEVYPEALDPFTGNYVGRWEAKVEVNPDVAAQVIPVGPDTYRVIIVNKLNMRCPLQLDVEVETQNGKLQFEDGVFVGETDGQTFSGQRGKLQYSMKKVEPKSPTLGQAAPAGAVVLFDGTNLDAWQKTKGWKITDQGALLVTPDGEALKSTQSFTDVKHLHVEFRLAYMPRSRGQDRSNSGVFLQDIYEVQVLDSFGLEGYYDECGALYKVAAPMVNAAYPPLTWQTYDIAFTAARYSADGALLSHPRMTVHHNGVLIHNDQEIPWITAWTEKEQLKPAPKDPKPFMIQAHNNFVEYRNIWLVEGN